jgi:hypothetical protein
MKKRKLFAIVLAFLMLFTTLSVFADSSDFSEPLGTGTWGGALSAIDTVAAAETNLDPLHPTTYLIAEVSGTVWFIDYNGIEYYATFYAHEDYVLGVSVIVPIPSGYKRFTRAESYHYGYIYGNDDTHYLSVTN